MKQKDSQVGSAVLNRALRVLDAIGELDQRGGVSLQQIADWVGENKSSVYRWLQSLREHGLVDQNPGTHTYRLGLKVLQLNGKLLSVLDFRPEALPILSDLASDTGETVHLGVRDRAEVVYVEKIDGPGNVIMRSQVGARNPLHCTGLGKALLAFLPASEIEQVVAAVLERRTDQTITDRVELLKCLEQIRLLGYAYDDRENEEEIRCMACPVFNHTGQVVAAISVAGLATRLNAERLPVLAVAVRSAAERLSARLGYQTVGTVHG